jgi:hypothetical protein
MPTNHTTPSRTVAVALAGAALGAALTFLGTVSYAASAFVGGARAGAVLVDQVRRSGPSRVGPRVATSPSDPSAPSAHVLWALADHRRHHLPKEPSHDQQPTPVQRRHDS